MCNKANSIVEANNTFSDYFASESSVIEERGALKARE
jgi:hypothetical protein